jgi:2-polyprenyl-6-methoxyphenol hydroxylase-like FAD-dependent oxidoreductase
MRTVSEAPNTDQVPEPIHRANQMYVERFVLEHAKARPRIDLRFGWHVDDFEQDSDCVRLHAHSTEGMAESLQAKFLVGCDGGRSQVRHKLGVKYQGEVGIEQQYFGGRMFSTYVRAPTLFKDHLAHRRAWQYWAVNPEIRSSIVSVNGCEEFLLRTRASTPDQPPDDAAVADVMRRCVGGDIALEIIAHEPWTAPIFLSTRPFGASSL